MYCILKVYKNHFYFRCLQDDDMEHDRWRPPIKRRKKSMQKYLLNFINIFFSYFDENDVYVHDYISIYIFTVLTLNEENVNEKKRE